MLFVWMVLFVVLFCVKRLQLNAFGGYFADLLCKHIIDYIIAYLIILTAESKKNFLFFT